MSNSFVDLVFAILVNSLNVDSPEYRMLTAQCGSPAQTVGIIVVVDSLHWRRVTCIVIVATLGRNACLLVLVDCPAFESRGFAHSRSFVGLFGVHSPRGSRKSVPLINSVPAAVAARSCPTSHRPRFGRADAPGRRGRTCRWSSRLPHSRST